MQIGIRHETRYDYEEAVSGAVMRLRLIPPMTSGQKIDSWRVTVNDEALERWVATGYGDSETLWRASGPVDTIRIVAEGDVETVDSAGVSQRLLGVPRPLLFMRSTALTTPSAALADLAASVRSNDGTLDELHRLMARIFETIAWRAGCTTVATTAAEAFDLRAGVCQDQSHIFITAARLLGVPARYVTGYLRDPDRPDGEHDPHAWAEAWVEGVGWIGFDCSLGHCPVEGHVRLTVGLDAADAAPIRGVVAHGSAARLSNDVQIANLPRDTLAQAQTQQ